MSKISINNTANNEEAKSITFRLKPHVANGIRELARNERLSIGEAVERLLNNYTLDTCFDHAENAFFVRCINRIDPEKSSSVKKVNFMGKIIYNTKRQKFKSAAPYADKLRAAFNISTEIDLSTWLVSDSVSIACLEVYEEDENSLLIQETLVLKESENTDFSIYCQWVRTTEGTANITASFSPFVNTEDIVAVSSIFAEDVEIFEAEAFIPNFENI